MRPAARGRARRSCGCATPASASRPSMLARRLRPVRPGRPARWTAAAGRAGARADAGQGGWSSCTAATSRRPATGRAAAAEFVVRLPLAARRPRPAADGPAARRAGGRRPAGADRRGQRRRGRQPGAAAGGVRPRGGRWRRHGPGGRAGGRGRVAGRGAVRHRAAGHGRLRGGAGAAAGPGDGGAPADRRDRLRPGRGPPRRSREAGFDHHLVKPVDPAVLLGHIEGPAAWPRPPGDSRCRPNGTRCWRASCTTRSTPSSSQPATGHATCARR